MGEDEETRVNTGQEIAEPTQEQLEQVLHLQEKKEAQAPKASKGQSLHDDFRRRVAEERKAWQDVLKSLDRLSSIRFDEDNSPAQEKEDEAATLSLDEIKQRQVAIPSVKELEKLLATNELSMKTAGEAVSQIANLRFGSVQEIQRFGPLIEAVLDAFQRIANNIRTVKAYQADSHNLQKQRLEVGLKAAGLSSTKELNLQLNKLEEESNKLWDQKYKLQREFFGLGRMINLQELRAINLKRRELREKSSGLYKIRRMEYEGSLAVYNPHASDYDRRAITADTINNFGKKLRAWYERMQQEFKDQVEPQNRLDPQTIASLNEEYLEKYFQRDVAKAKEFHTDPEIEAFLQEESNIQKAEDLLRRGFGMRANIKYYRRNLSEEEDQELEAFSHDVESLPFILRDLVNRHLNHSDAGIAANARYEGMGRFVKELPKFQDQDALYQTYNKLVQNLQRFSDKYRIDWDLEKSWRNLNQDEAQKQRDKFISDIDMERWDVFRTHPQILAKFGSEQVEAADRLLHQRIEDRILQLSNHTDECIKLGAKLYYFKTAADVPLAILNAFREGGHSGEMPFITFHASPDKTVLYQYINSLDNKELEKLKDLHIPGCTEIVDLIKKNPKNFCQSSILIPRADNKVEYIDNPVYQEIQQHLARISAYFLQHREYKMDFYLMDLLERLKTDLGTGYESIKKILTGKADQRVQDQTLNCLIDRIVYGYGHNQEIRLLQENYQQFDERIRFGLRQSTYRIFEKIKNEEPNNLNFLQEILGQSKERILATMTFVHALGKDNSFLRSEENLEVCLELAGDSRVLPLIQKLQSYGFYFDASRKDAALIPELLAHEGEILGDLAEVKKCYPYFNYQPRALANGHAELDPYELLVRYYAGTISQQSLENLKARPAMTQDNWHEILIAYAIEEGGFDVKMSPEMTNYLKNILGNEHPENQNLCLRELHGAYRDFLVGKGKERYPLNYLTAVSIINESGAGNLKYIEALGQHMGEVRKLMANGQISEELKTEIIAGLSGQEQRFAKERWSEDDKSIFYSISKNILHASPPVYQELLTASREFTPKELQKFVAEYLPLYQARLILAETNPGHYNVSGLLGLQKDFAELGQVLAQASDNEQRNQIWQNVRTASIERIQGNFKEKFGLLKTPEEWNAEQLRFVQNFVRYLGAIRGRNQDKENLIAFYLGLNINGEWEKFRNNEKILPENYFAGDKLSFIQGYLTEREQLNVIVPENIGITPEQTANFQELLQEETLSEFLGNVQTIDERLGVLSRNLDQLGDEDIYTEAKERRLFHLCRQYGKAIGAALAVEFRQVSGKGGESPAGQGEIIRELRDIYQKQALDTADIKTIQDEIRPYSLVANVLSNLESKKVNVEIGELQKRLRPPMEVVEIFNRLGENFRPESGALALSQDLAYLENIIVKDSEKLQPGEHERLQTYLDVIRSQMQRLEQIYQELTVHVNKLSGSVHTEAGSILNARLREIQTIMNTSTATTQVVSRLTNNFNLIIENMRQCLGCLANEVNNDTNLSFGDSNKFYVLSQSAHQKGSMADEIVFFCPTVSTPEEPQRKELSFVMDRIYGNKSSDILLSHIKAVVKKLDQLKVRFPGAKLSVVVPNEALGSVGLSEQLLIEKLSELDIQPERATNAEKITVTISKSASGDHYVEFGNLGARTAGDRETKGVIIR